MDEELERYAHYRKSYLNLLLLIPSEARLKLLNIDLPIDPLTQPELSDEINGLVLSAFTNTRHDFRSPESLANQLALPVETIRHYIDSNPELIRKPLVPAHDGKELYTLQSRTPRWRERYAHIRACITRHLP